MSTPISHIYVMCETGTFILDQVAPLSTPSSTFQPNPSLMIPEENSSFDSQGRLGEKMSLSNFSSYFCFPTRVLQVLLAEAFIPFFPPSFYLVLPASTPAMHQNSWMSG